MSATRESGTVTLADGQIQGSGPYTLEAKRPNKSRLERGLGGHVDVRAYDGSTAWSLTGLRLEVLQGESARALAENDFDSVFLDSASRGITIALVGSARVGHASAYKLLVNKRGEARYSYIDKESFLEIRREYLEDGRPRSYQVLGGHRTFAGITRPTVFEIGQEGRPGRMIVVVERVEINPDIPDERFRLP